MRAIKRSSAKKLHEKFLKPLLGPLALAIGIFYFTFHVLSGEHGLYALLKEERKLEVLKAELADASAKRKDLEQHVRLMSDGSLDLDLLDEQARIILNDTSQDEAVVPFADSPSRSIARPN